MIDSINFVIEGIKRLDKEYLEKQLGVNIKYNKEFEMETFIYNDIKFIYYILNKNLEVETTTHKILLKKDVTLSDKKIFEEKVNNIINYILHTNQHYDNFKLTRADYYVDIYVGDKLQEYMKLLHKHRNKFGHLKSINQYDSSMYLQTKFGKTINFYDKERCIKEKCQKEKNKIRRKYKNEEEKMLFKIKKIEEKENEECNMYKNVIRLEVQNPKATLKSNLKTSKKSKRKEVVIAKRSLEYYWCQESMQEHYFKLLEKYLYKGNYYKMSKAIEIIQKSQLTQNWKNKLIIFLGSIKYYNVDEIKNNAYNYNTFECYIKKLNELNINPITIDENCDFDMLEGLYTIAIKQAEEKYFK